MSCPKIRHIREPKQTTTGTAARTSPNKCLMSTTMAVHVRYKSLFVSQLSSARTMAADFSNFHLELSTGMTSLA